MSNNRKYQASATLSYKCKNKSVKSCRQDDHKLKMKLIITGKLKPMKQTKDHGT